VGGETKIECGRKCESAREHERQTEKEGWMKWGEREKARKGARKRVRDAPSPGQGGREDGT